MYKHKTMPGLLVIQINLNEIYWKTNNLKMIVQSKVQCFKGINDWKMSVGLKQSSINLLIYDGKTSYSLSKQDSSNLLINLGFLRLFI